MKTVAVIFMLTITVVSMECASHQGVKKDASQKKMYTIIKNIINSNSLQCDPSGCNSDCVGKGYSGGFCFAGACWCILGENPEKKIYTIKNINPGNLQCDPSGCNSDCVGKGYPGGFCFAGACWCILGEEPEKKISAIKNMNCNNLQCDPSDCNSDCAGKGYPGGFCFAGACWCILGKEPEIVLNKV